jgi:hypothetical protein
MRLPMMLLITSEPPPARFLKDDLTHRRVVGRRHDLGQKRHGLIRPFALSRSAIDKAIRLGAHAGVDISSGMASSNASLDHSPFGFCFNATLISLF